MTPHIITWIVIAVAILGVITRPFAWPEAVWAVAGAALLVVFRLLPAADAWTGVRKGLDVYLFLVGMMLLAEIARKEGLFDWLAGHAVRQARGSASRLFLLIFIVGTIVTTFLSNDATAVVLTPAVYAAAKAAGAKPLPYLFICAMIANAASFVLPISNPANLVVYASHMPPLGPWLMRFGVASILSVVATFVVLRWTQRAELRDRIETDVEIKALSLNGTIAGLGIVLTGGVLIAASASGRELGLPTFAAGLLTVAVATNLVNNLPAGLLAGAAVQTAHVHDTVSGAILIGVDLGPNLSVTGSLATILWLNAIRREGEHVGTWTFLKLGLMVMPPALLAALAGLLILP